MIGVAQRGPLVGSRSFGRSSGQSGSNAVDAITRSILRAVEVKYNPLFASKEPVVHCTARVAFHQDARPVRNAYVYVDGFSTPIVLSKTWPPARRPPLRHPRRAARSHSTARANHQSVVSCPCPQTRCHASIAVRDVAPVGSARCAASHRPSLEARHPYESRSFTVSSRPGPSASCRSPRHPATKRWLGLVNVAARRGSVRSMAMAPSTPPNREQPRRIPSRGSRSGGLRLRVIARIPQPHPLVRQPVWRRPAPFDFALWCKGVRAHHCECFRQEWSVLLGSRHAEYGARCFLRRVEFGYAHRRRCCRSALCVRARPFVCKAKSKSAVQILVRFTHRVTVFVESPPIMRVQPTPVA